MASRTWCTRAPKVRLTAAHAHSNPSTSRAAAKILGTLFTTTSCRSTVLGHVPVRVLVAERQAHAARVVRVERQPALGQLGAPLQGGVLAEVGQHLVLLLGEVLAVLGASLPHARPP